MTALPAVAPAISVRGLTYRLSGRAILSDVTFDVAAGEYLSIIGPNGAGKTTLLKCIDRLLGGATGEIRVAGRPLQNYRPRDLAKRIGYVPQVDGRLWPFSVEQFVLMGRYPYLSPFTTVSREDRQIVRHALDCTGTAEFADRRLNTLSGGERQKVLIAAALAQEADILLLDEPTTFLDYRCQAEIRGLLADAHRRQRTIVAVTHDVNGAAMESDHVLALVEGRVVFHGSPPELMRREVLRGIYGADLPLVMHPEADVPLIVPPLARPKTAAGGDGP